MKVYLPRGPDTNSGKSWSEMDVLDLQQSIRYGDTIEDAALFLCRSVEETRAKAKELGLELRRAPPRKKAAPEPASKPKPEDATHRWKGRLVPNRVANKPKD
jgi:hypothetical protein